MQRKLKMKRRYYTEGKTLMAALSTEHFHLQGIALKSTPFISLAAAENMDKRQKASYSLVYYFIWNEKTLSKDPQTRSVKILW